MNIILLSGAIIGLLSVVMGAYFDHALKMSLDARMIDAVSTAIQYHQFYSLIITCIGLCLFLPMDKGISIRLVWAAWIFFIAVILFSFSIYLSATTGVTGLIKLVPVGGVLFMVGWVMLMWVALSRAKLVSNRK